MSKSSNDEMSAFERATLALQQRQVEATLANTVAIREAREPLPVDPDGARNELNRLRRANDGVAEAVSQKLYNLPALEERTGTIDVTLQPGPIDHGNHGRLVSQVGGRLRVACTVEIVRHAATGPKGVVRNIAVTDEAMSTILIPFFTKQWDAAHDSQWREAAALTEHKMHLEDRRAKELPREIYWSFERPTLNAIVGFAPDASGLLTLDASPEASAAAE